MNIRKLLNYTQKPRLYEPGNSLMWTDPYISKKLLECHISQNTDAASRSDDKIEIIVDWIDSQLSPKKLNILDLGCGPGLYAEKLAKKGHNITGVDFSYTSIEYAKNQTVQNNSNIIYYCKNYLNIDFIDCFDVVIMIYLDFCVLSPEERTIVLDKIYRSLKKGGFFIFDVVNSKNIDEKLINPTWEVCKKGFWKDSPYIVLNKGYHYKKDKVILNQHIVISEDEEIKTYHFWSIYYEYEDIKNIVEERKYKEIIKHDNVIPGNDIWTGENISFYIVYK